MTDNEIIKALKCCIRYDFRRRGRPCKDCPLLQDDFCSHSLRWYSLDLINRQKAEIERLKKEVEVKDSVYQRNTGLREKRIFDLMEELKTAKSEAIKEFAERLKLQVAIDLCEAINCSDYLQDDFPKIVDRLVKKMEGDSVGKVSNYDNPSVIS